MNNINLKICQDCNGEGTSMIAKLYPNGHTEVNEECKTCKGSGELETKEESLVGRYIKITNTLWFGSGYKVGEYLKIIRDNDKGCIKLEKFGEFSYSIFKKERFSELMPIGFNPNSESKTMSKEELLEEAKRRYPIGTNYKCVNGNSEIRSYPYYSNGIWTVTEYILKEDIGSSKYSIHSHNGWIYFNDEWAEIVSLPETNQTNNEVMNDKHYPKKGEWIVRELPGDNSNFLTKDKAYQVLENTKIGNNIVKVIDDTGNSGVFNLSYFRKALPHEIPTTSNNSDSLSSLPEKWMIEVNSPEQFNLVLKHIATIHNIPNYHFSNNRGYSKYLRCNNVDWAYNSTISSSFHNHTKITFGDFLRLTGSKQSHSDQMIDVMNNDKGRYFRCLEDIYSYGKKGRIYEFHYTLGEDWVMQCNLDCGNYPVGSKLFFSPKDFEESTREAYISQSLSVPNIKTAEISMKQEVKSEEKWKVGGYVRNIGKLYSYIFRFNSIGKITSSSPKGVIVLEEGENLNKSQATYTFNDWETELEWLGMNKPQELLEEDYQKVQNGEMKLSDYIQELPRTNVFLELDQDSSIKGFERGEYYLMGIDPITPKKVKSSPQIIVKAESEISINVKQKRKVKI